MSANASRIPSITISQDLAEGADVALARLQESLAPGVSRDRRRGALLEFVRSAAVSEIIDLALASQVRAQLGRDACCSDKMLRRAIARAAWSAIYRKVRPVPRTVTELAGLAETVAAKMIAEGQRVAVITDRSDAAARGREAEIYAMGAAGCDGLAGRPDAYEDAKQDAMCDGLLALEVSTVDQLGDADLGDCPAEPEAYLYLEDLDTWFAALMASYVKRARTSASFRRRSASVPPRMEEFPDPRGEEEDDHDASGGVRLTSWQPPASPGPGTLAVARVGREREDVRVGAVRDLVKTAEEMLHGKQRAALLTKLFSPKRREVRRTLLLICGAVLSEVPREVGNDEELARLIGSPNGSAAQRNYNHARAKLLTYAKDAEQRHIWQIILDALLPRRSRN